MTRSQACAFVGGCPSPDACSRAETCIERRRRVTIANAAQCGSRALTAEIQRLVSVDLLRECQHDPPCGAAHCSACEMQRLDGRLHTLAVLFERELAKRTARSVRISRGKLAHWLRIAEGETG